ncbi:twin-arginine translocation signal domain-containing protein [Streptomyces sp. 5-8]|uniref:Twin-arginine translocation signal domain-containing protein n=1 Tax=Streptomyces musisoli TaxID=2802280 RepID=A0ABS1PCA1_9ACTN|nr:MULTISPECIES: twin-arginine translocation signal domain-containing protein [Streptomyces]MBL1109999.1 twin-arginine translocation signal domain-containing protein [Streptomyces musisoli]MBY8841380.1 twin-arginine translocation signal domain-containing protein [Streptomyces sp. SP2-10]
MTSISRRSLLGYSGTTAAGAMIGGTVSAPQAQAAQAQAAQAETAQAETETAAADFPRGTLFDGVASLNADRDMPYELQIKFSVTTEEAPAANAITPQEIARLLSDFAVSKGWPPVTFYGTPAPAPLN